MMNTTLPNSEQFDSVDQKDWREDFLQRILIITGIVGAIALIFALGSTTDLLVQAVYIIAYAILVGSILIRLPYIVKANIFVLLPLLLGIGGISDTGIRGDSLFFLLAYVTFSTLLVGSQGGAIAILVSEIVIIVMGYLINNDLMILSDVSMPKGDIVHWITAGASHLMISLVVLFGLRMLLKGFEQARVKNEEMLQNLRESQSQLEIRVDERTEQLGRKTNQMTASTFVAHQAASIQDLKTLLDSSVELISKQFHLYHVAIFLINPRGDHAVLQAASSKGGNQLLENGFTLRIGSEGIVGYVAAEKKPRIAMNVNEDLYYAYNENLPDTQSELALPMVVRNQVIGVLDMQSTELNAFQQDEIELYQTLTDQIAIAIENARLLTESQLIITQLETITAENTRRNWRHEISLGKPGYYYSATGVKSMDGQKLPEGKTTLSIPIMLRGQQIGKIALNRKDKFKVWTKQEESVANEVANQTALALENIRLVERTKQRANREQLISAVTARVRETLDLDTVLRTSATEIQQALNLDEAEILVFSQDELNDQSENQNSISGSEK